MKRAAEVDEPNPSSPAIVTETNRSGDL